MCFMTVGGPDSSRELTPGPREDSRNSAARVVLQWRDAAFIAYCMDQESMAS